MNLDNNQIPQLVLQNMPRVTLGSDQDVISSYIAHGGAIPSDNVINRGWAAIRDHYSRGFVRDDEMNRYHTINNIAIGMNPNLHFRAKKSPTKAKKSVKKAKKSVKKAKKIPKKVKKSVKKAKKSY